MKAVLNIYKFYVKAIRGLSCEASGGNLGGKNTQATESSIKDFSDVECYFESYIIVSRLMYSVVFFFA